MNFSLEEKLDICHKAVVDKKGNNIVILDLKEISSFTDYFIICSGTSTKQVQSIADEIIERLRASGEKGLNIEGYQIGRWVLIDCIDFVIHVFHKEARNFYDIERLWGDAHPIKFALDN